jgi:hypothetical protein
VLFAQAYKRETACGAEEIDEVNFARCPKVRECPESYKEAWTIYKIVQNQLIVGFSGAIDLNYLALLEVIKMFYPEGNKELFFQVRNIYIEIENARKTLKKDEGLSDFQEKQKKCLSR